MLALFQEFLEIRCLGVLQIQSFIKITNFSLIESDLLKPFIYLNFDTYNLILRKQNHHFFIQSH